MADVQAEFEIVEPELTKPTFEVVDENGVQKVEIIGFFDPEVTPEDVAGREVTVRKSIVLGNGRININELTAYVENKVAAVKAMDVTTADEKDIKAAQATLNKTAKELSDVRIAMQKVWAEPFNQNIADPIKKLVAYIDEQKKPVADKLDEIQRVFETARKAEIAEIKAERLAKESESVDRYIRSLTWFDDEKWLNKTVTAKKIASELDAKVVQVVADITAIGMLNEGNPFGPQLMDEYRSNNGNLARTLMKSKELEEAAQRYARMEEERKAKEAEDAAERERAEAEAKAKREAFAEGGTVTIGTTEPPKFMRDEPEVVVPIPTEQAVDLPPVKGPEKQYVVTFKMKGTTSDLAKVIEYMRSIGVKSQFVSQEEAKV
ncbi:MAG: DUF1351 domain-containing protein [Paludibacteraceae bacterium]